MDSKTNRIAISLMGDNTLSIKGAFNVEEEKKGDELFFGIDTAFVFSDNVQEGIAKLKRLGIEREQRNIKIAENRISIYNGINE